MKTLSPIKLFIIVIFFLGQINSFAQIIYSDLIPDKAIYQGDIPIDFNEDKAIDVTFHYTYYCSQYGENSETNALLSGTTSGKSCFLEGDSIGGNLEWPLNNETFLQMIVYWDNYYQGCWDDIPLRFVAFRIKVNNQYHYAWVRIYTPNDAIPYRLVVADYAYNTVPNEPILAGQGMPAGATSVLAKDQPNFFDGRDIKASFTKAIDESLFSEYRIMVAKANDTSAYDLEHMSQLGEDRYFALPITTNGEHVFTVVQSLFSNTKDIDGDAIEALQDYRVHILNVSNSGNTTQNILSTPSNIFHLKKPILPLENIIVTDINNNNSSSDINMTFWERESEPALQEYRIFVCKKEEADDFNLESALQLAEAYYTTQIPQYGDHQVVLKEGQLDISGAVIQEGIFYKVFILSVADSILSKTSLLSSSSRKIILANPNYLYAGQKTGENLSWYVCDAYFSDYLFWGSEYPMDEYVSYIDVNRDGVNDFYVYGEDNDDWTGNSELFYLRGERNNKVIICEHANHNNWIEVLKYGEGIGDGYAKTSANAIIVDYKTRGSAYNWELIYFHGHVNSSLYNQDTNLIAVQINDNVPAQYAWIKLVGNKFVEYGFQDQNSGTENLESQNQYLIYPNPSNGIINVEILQATQKEIRVNIVNSIGIKTDEFILKEQLNQINLKHYPSGLYFCVIIEEGMIIETQKIVVK